MTVTNEQIQALKAAADDIGSEEWQYMRSSNFSNGYITNSEGKTVVNVTDGDVPARYARFIELANPVAILSLLAERDADKKQLEQLVADRMSLLKTMGVYVHAYEEAKSHIAELETRTLTVKLPQRATADKYVDGNFDNSDLAAIYNTCRLECEVKIKNACAAAGITLVVGE